MEGLKSYVLFKNCKKALRFVKYCLMFVKYENGTGIFMHEHNEIDSKIKCTFISKSSYEEVHLAVDFHSMVVCRYLLF